MFRKLLSPDSGLMITMTQITDCIFLSLFFLISCVPVVTIGAAMAALYDAVYHGFRRGDKHCWQRYWRSLGSNFRGSLIPLTVYGAVFWADGWAMIQLWNGAVAGQWSWMVFSGGAVVGALVLGILSVLFPMLSRFENPTGVLLKNTVLLALANLPGTLALGMVNGAALILCLWMVVPVCFLPGLAALISTLFLEPMFRPYLPQPEEPAEA